MVEKMGEGRESGLVRMGTVVDDEEEASDGKTRDTGRDAIIDIREA
jgi:hypothetical protein